MKLEDRLVAVEAVVDAEVVAAAVPLPRPPSCARTARPRRAGTRKPIWPKSLFGSVLARSSGTRGGARGRRSRPTRRRSRTARRAGSWSSDEGVDHVGHERLAEPDVAERVLVGGQPVAAAAVAERRVDDRDVRQRAAEAVLVVARDRVDPGAPRGAEERGEGQVGGVVARGQPAADRAVEDRLPVVAARRDACCSSARPTGPTTCRSGSARWRRGSSRSSGRRSCSCAPPRG